VKVLVDEKQRAGYYVIKLGNDDLVSGVYFVKLKAGDFCATKKLVLLK
jgi:hypothetical protein